MPFLASPNLARQSLLDWFTRLEVLAFDIDVGDRERARKLHEDRNELCVLDFCDLHAYERRAAAVGSSARGDGHRAPDLLELDRGLATLRATPNYALRRDA